MVKRAKKYSRFTRVQGILAEMPDQLIKEVVELCQIQAKEDLEALGQGTRLPDLFWRCEQRYEGMVNGKRVIAPMDFDGAKPYVVVAWKLVS